MTTSSKTRGKHESERREGYIYRGRDGLFWGLVG